MEREQVADFAKGPHEGSASGDGRQRQHSPNPDYCHVYQVVWNSGDGVSDCANARCSA